MAVPTRSWSPADNSSADSTVGLALPLDFRDRAVARGQLYHFQDCRDRAAGRVRRCRRDCRCLAAGRGQLYHLRDCRDRTAGPGRPCRCPAIADRQVHSGRFRSDHWPCLDRSARLDLLDLLLDPGRCQRPVSRQDRSRQDRSRQDRSRQDHSRQDHLRQDRSRQDHSRQDHSRQDRSRQDCSRQDRSRRAFRRDSCPAGFAPRLDRYRTPGSRRDLRRRPAVATTPRMNCSPSATRRNRVRLALHSNLPAQCGRHR
jgi:hypothetical protein